MRTLDLSIPVKQGTDKNDVTRFLASKLYESGRLTLAQAAKTAGMATVDFAGIISQFGISFVNYPASDIKTDAANA